MANLAEVVKIDSSEFGLNEQSGNEIADKFSLATSDLQTLRERFLAVKDSEITPEVVNIATQLHKDAKTARTAINKTHKAQKEFFWNGGKFVDSLKNVYLDQLTPIIEGAENIRKHYKRLEEENAAKIEAARNAEILPYLLESEIGLIDLKNLSEEQYQNYLADKKQAFELRKKAQEAAEKKRLEEEAKAEKERKEKEAKQELEAKRRLKTSRLANFIDNYETLVFAELSEAEYKLLCERAIVKRTEYESEQEKIRLENEKLKKEAEAKKKIAAERGEILQPYMQFVSDFQKTIDLSESDFLAEVKRLKESLKVWNKRIADEKRKNKEAAEKAKAEKERADRIAKELQEQKDKEAREEKEAEEKRQSELAKGDKDKLLDLISDLEILKTKYVFRSEENKKKYEKAGKLIDKLIEFIS